MRALAAAGGGAVSGFNGPGKYDAECTAAREACGAQGAVLIVYEGQRGMGFSVQGPMPMVVGLPSVLRDVADQIEAQLRGGSQS
ncbi:MAG: hypothetical protein RL685_1564 [Pseudomonadota bacterium]|jgi:hypothetical protein